MCALDGDPLKLGACLWGREERARDSSQHRQNGFFETETPGQLQKTSNEKIYTMDLLRSLYVLTQV